MCAKDLKASEHNSAGEKETWDLPHHEHPNHNKLLTWWSMGYGQRYEHQPLPGDGDYIRLFRFAKSPDAEARNGGRTNMITGYLDTVRFTIVKQPPYLTLSYTWGPPEEGCWQQNEILRPILLNGRQYLVQRNLHEALCAIRDLIDKGSLSFDHIWIDALCINQGDVDERSRQVRMMSLIYCYADSVIIWLGESKGAAVRRVEILSKKCSTLAADVQREARIQQKSSHVYWQEDVNSFQRFIDEGLPPPQECYWRGFAAFIQRRWWSRCWAIQEMIVPRQRMLLCGRTILPYESLSVTVNSLLNWDMIKWLKFHNGKEIVTVPGSDCSTMFYIQEELQRLPLKMDYQAFAVGEAEYKRTPWAVLFYLLDMSAAHQATDIRDTVFSLLCLVDLATYSKDGWPLLRADYQKDMATVCIDVAKYIISNSNWLGILALDAFGSRSLRRITPNLPSYVPDFADRPHLDFVEEHFDKRRFPPLLALANRAPHCGIPRFKTDWLDIYGVRIGDVAAMSEPTMSFVKSDCLYAEGAKVISELEDWYSYTNQSRFEAAWRTILEDDEEVRDRSLGDQFCYYWVKHIIDHLADKSEGSPESMSAFLQQHPTMDGLFQSIEKMTEILQRCHTEWQPHVLSGTEVQESPLYNEICKQSKSFQYWIGIHSLGCRLFRTDKGHLGNSKHPEVQVGDSVWVLARAPCSFILRKTGGDRYILVARAHVHGFDTGGTIMQELGDEWENIILE